jgi:hypothetical protein
MSEQVVKNEVDDWGLGITVDPEAIKEQFDKEKDSGQQKWRLSIGKKLTKATVRLLPNPHRDSHYYTLYWHFNIEKFGLLCINKTLNQACPICQEFEKLKKELSTQQAAYQKEHPEVDIRAKFKPDWRMLFQLDSKPRYYMAVISRVDSIPEIKYLDMSQTIKDIVIPKIIEKPIYMHPLQGRDWKFEYVPKGMKDGKEIGDVKVDRDDDPSPILASGKIDEIRTLVHSIPDLMKLVDVPTYADLKLALDSLNEEETSETPVSTPENEAAKDNGAVVVDKKVATDKIMDEFFKKQ